MTVAVTVAHIGKSVHIVLKHIWTYIHMDLARLCHAVRGPTTGCVALYLVPCRQLAHALDEGDVSCALANHKRKGVLFHTAVSKGSIEQDIERLPGRALQ